jgi:uncharacterized protein GlcG (DUF336 family)
MKKTLISLALLGSLAAVSSVALADSKEQNSCAALPSYTALKNALIAARHQVNGGFNLDMWGTVVDRDGVVCAVAFTGLQRGDQWPGSRVISAQKANTANAFSLPHLSLSTANLYTAVQPGGSLYGLQASNPVDTEVAYKGPSKDYGQGNDPLVGNKIGGVNVFGGGLALYNNAHVLIGAIGVSGDSSCADHNIAWRTRSALNLDYVPGGVSGDALHSDSIVYDYSPASATQLAGASTSGWGHPDCPGSTPATLFAIASALPPVKK